MNASIPPDPDAGSAALTPLDEHHCIAGDVACLQCGYNLRGLPPTTTCPECGLDVERSFHHNLLIFADPAWLAKTADGAFVLGLALATCYVNFCAMFMPSLITMTLRAFTLSAVAIGVWLVTRPEPLAPGQQPRKLTVRLAARVLCVVAPLAMISAMAWQVQTAGSAYAAPDWSSPRHIVGFVLLQALPVLLMSSLALVTGVYAAGLAWRVPHGRLAAVLLALGVAIAFGYAIAWIGIAAQYFAPRFEPLKQTPWLNQMAFDLNATAIGWLILPMAVLLPFLVLGAIIALLRLARMLRLLSLGERIDESIDE